MHLLVPHAGLPATLDETETLPELPNLQMLLSSMAPATDPDAGNERSLSPPHERALARLWQWPLADGLLPFAAQAAAADGLQSAIDAAGPDVGWGLLRPTYWHLGTERVALVDPAELQLTDVDSRRLFGAVAGLFDIDGWALHWGAATRWYAVHPSLRQLPTASLDRVVGRNIDLWLAAHPEARAVRRLQAEAQMSLHDHPVNSARAAAGLAPVNSFWLSGTGVTRAAVDVPGLHVEDGLRRAALAADTRGWTEAWQAIDRECLPAAVYRANSGRPVQLTLCGERSSRSFSTPLRPRWRRLLDRRRDLRAFLAAL